MKPSEWLARLDELKASMQTFRDDARSEDHPAEDALCDMLDALRDEYLEDAQAGRRRVRGRPAKPLPPSLRPAAAFVEKLLRRWAVSLEWSAAGLRTRLKQS
jgi:hypothetical protein